MTDSSRRASNVAMEQIIGNMTSGMHNADGQYIQLGFTPPPSPSDHHTWGTQSQLPKSPYMQYSLTSVHSPEQHAIYSMNQQLPQYGPQAVPYNYVQQSNLYGADPFEKSNEVHPTSNSYVMFQDQNIQNKTGVQDLGGLYQPDYRFFVSQDLHGLNHAAADGNFIHNHHDNVILTNSAQSIPNPTQLIENVVGNWVPNTSGTYSPFGNMQSSKQGISNIFEMQPDMECFGMVSQIFDDCKPSAPENESKSDEILNFHFSRDTKKPRMVAEVKPMRPSYSDVLTKSAPQTTTKSGRLDIKDAKQKKENGKKVSKSDKTQKLSSSHRLNSSDIKIDKVAANTKSSEKAIKNGKSSQLNRKWASLDNVNGSGSDLNEDEGRKSKKAEEATLNNKNSSKVNQQKTGKRSTDFEDTDLGNSKSDALNITKTSIRKGSKLTVKQKTPDGFSSSDKQPPGKRSQRIRKRENHVPFGIVGEKIKQYVPGWWKLFVNVCLWLIHLISDICSLSVHLSRDMVCNFCKWFMVQWATFLDATVTILGRIRFLTWLWEKVTKKHEAEESGRTFLHPGLQHNILMPATGEEAMKRLLACKGKDPYSILGVTPTCTDDDIKRYYKRQAFLVHPDKNQQPGAEEAFKILVHAFDMIGEPDRRAAYDRGVAESAQVEQAWSELTELLAQLQKKVEAAANTIRCSACGLRHKRIKIERPSYAARNCSTCKIHHSAREGDIWAEARCLGFLWHYYACMEGGVYDITDWAGCQKDSLKHLRPDSHHVQYRIALGKQNGQTRRHSASPRNERPPDLENLLNSLYGNQDSSQNTRRRNKKTSK